MVAIDVVVFSPRDCADEFGLAGTQQVEASRFDEVARWQEDTGDAMIAGLLQDSGVDGTVMGESGYNGIDV